MRHVHERLREALRMTREALDGGVGAGLATRDLLLYCRGFCTALTSHHEGEDRALFPALAAAHPDLQETLRKLEEDHSMIAHLLGELQEAVDRAANPAELERHLEGIAAIMESHFRYKERRLLSALETLDLKEDPAKVFGRL